MNRLARLVIAAAAVGVAAVTSVPASASASTLPPPAPTSNLHPADGLVRGLMTVATGPGGAQATAGYATRPDEVTFTLHALVPGQADISNVQMSMSTTSTGKFVSAELTTIDHDGHVTTRPVPIASNGSASATIKSATGGTDSTLSGRAEVTGSVYDTLAASGVVGDDNYWTSNAAATVITAGPGHCGPTGQGPAVCVDGTVGGTGALSMCLSSVATAITRPETAWTVPATAVTTWHPSSGLDRGTPVCMPVSSPDPTMPDGNAFRVLSRLLTTPTAPPPGSPTGTYAGKIKPGLVDGWYAADITTSYEACSSTDGLIDACTEPWDEFDFADAQTVFCDQSVDGWVGDAEVQSCAAPAAPRPAPVTPRPHRPPVVPVPVTPVPVAPGPHRPPVHVDAGGGAAARRNADPAIEAGLAVALLVCAASTVLSRRPRPVGR